MAFGNIDAIIDELERFASRAVVKLSLDVTANLYAAPSEGGTPVDTGWARVNWIPSIGQAIAKPSGTRESVSGTAQQAGMASLGGYHITDGMVFVANPVPYIVKLNEGSSPQAEAQFVERAVEKAVFVDMLGLSP